MTGRYTYRRLRRVFVNLVDVWRFEQVPLVDGGLGEAGYAGDWSADSSDVGTSFANGVPVCEDDGLVRGVEVVKGMIGSCTRCRGVVRATRGEVSTSVKRG